MTNVGLPVAPMLMQQSSFSGQVYQFSLFAYTSWPTTAGPIMSPIPA